jgi:hypothetical protein
VAATGALGITKASVLLTVRGRLDQWSQLLWHRAVVQKVVDSTLTLDEVLPAPAPARRRRRAAGAMGRVRPRWFTPRVASNGYAVTSQPK